MIGGILRRSRLYRGSKGAPVVIAMPVIPEFCLALKDDKARLDWSEYLTPGKAYGLRRLSATVQGF